MPTGSEIPVWQLESIYPGFDSGEYWAARKQLDAVSTELLEILGNGAASAGDPGEWLEKVLDGLTRGFGLFQNLSGKIFYIIDI